MFDFHQETRIFLSQGGSCALRGAVTPISGVLTHSLKLAPAAEMWRG